MSRNVMLVPVGDTSGIFTASIGLVKALNDSGLKAALFTPIFSCPCAQCNISSLNKMNVAKAIADGRRSDVLERIVANYNTLKNSDNYDVIVIEGVTDAPFDINELNAQICHAFDASIITITDCDCSCSKAKTKATLNYFGSKAKKQHLGSVLLNPVAPKDANGHKKLVLSGCGCNCTCDVNNDKESTSCSDKCCNDFLATVNFDKAYYAPVAKNIALYLNGSVVSGNETTRGYKVALNAAKTNERSVLVTDTMPNECKASIIILSDGQTGSFDGATVISSPKSLWATLQALSSFPTVLFEGDKEQYEYIQSHASADFGSKIIDVIESIQDKEYPLMSPASFRRKLTELAIAANKKIALPEGDEPRTVCAAAKVAKDGIAIPVLFGKKDKILEVAKEQNVELNDKVIYVDPDEVRSNYVARLVELRGAKGVTEDIALELLKDNVFLATMMIENNELDGLVSGAVHTTANTIRPPLQIIKTAPNAKLVSAIFFMLMEEQVYVYGDCALNIKPNADELSEIAIQSADTAKAFGIDPRVAMVTYSTMNSGKGEDVDLMREATELVRQKRPDICVDGPLQYDAAVMEDVAAQKAPNSAVAGKATVFIFPSLSTGNTVYKAVQRSANLVSIGPMLQGMKKPVNDLSRGALVDDIIYTIAVTAIQATKC